MPNKSNKSKEASTSEYDDISGIRASLSKIESKLDEITKLRKDFDKLLKSVKTIESESAEKDERIKALKQKVEDLEQYSRMNDVIISELKTTHKTYTRAVNNDGQDYQDAPETEITTVENQVVAFIRSKLEVEIEPNEIEACHTLKGKKEVPNIIVRVINRKSKTSLMRNAKN